MPGKIANKLLKAAREAANHAEGKRVPSMREYQVMVPMRVDVKATRKKMDLTQEAFAQMFGFPLSTLKKWESGQRQPELAARILLRTIERFPEKVIEANQSPRR